MPLHTDRRKRSEQTPTSTVAEPDGRQVDLARQQGDAYGAALELMATEFATAAETTVRGDYEIAYTIEPGGGRWEMRDDRLAWLEPDNGASRVEVAIRDSADGRFIPDLDVAVTIRTSDGVEVGTHPHQLAWHPMMYHYAHDWQLPEAESYTIRVRVRPPQFHRHDKGSGKRFTEPVEVEFRDVEIR